MSRRSSQRALAREICRQMVAARAAPTADPPSPGGFGGQGLTAQNLTEKVRSLYEHSAVPVAEIARLAGVTERTIYKYAAKEQWTPRYAWAADGSRPRGWRAAKRFASDFVPVRGAGGRFIRRADEGKPFATGLKATDAAAAALAAAACRREEAASRAAQEKAKAAQHAEAEIRAMTRSAGRCRSSTGFWTSATRRLRLRGATTASSGCSCARPISRSSAGNGCRRIRRGIVRRLAR